MMRTLAVVLATLVSLLIFSPPAAAAEWMVRLEVGEQQIEGTPLSWSSSRVYLLGRDGRLWDFAPQSARNFQRTAPSFESYSAAHIRSYLIRELGSGFEVTGTGHYLVAHPRGESGVWSQRFEDLYRSFVHFFRVRGFSLSEPQFPLVAIVWPTQQDFIRYAQRDGMTGSRNVLGYYSSISNRITLYDVGAGSGDDEAWKLNAETIIHEATHQTAFNTGVHRRFAHTPKWVIEGLGTLFESPGVWDSLANHHASDRVNRYQLDAFRRYAKQGRKPGSLAHFVSDDRQFRANVGAAYAESWALTHFLIETRPRQYAAYMQRTAQREVFEEYPPSERLADFTAAFGNDLRLFEAHFLRFIEQIR